MKVVVTGGRDFTDQEFIFKTLNEIHKETPITFLVSGMAKGVDESCFKWAMKNEINTMCVPAKWKRDGKAAGPIRNKEMADMFDYDLVIAFPGGKGTAHMVKYCKALKLNVQEYKKD